MVEQQDLKARDLEQAVRLLDGKRPLKYLSPEWNAYYSRTPRPEVDRLINAFSINNLGHKALFGGHSGNGKSTELNRFKGHPKINQRFWVIAADVADSLNPMDLEIVELLLLMISETLAFADQQDMKIEGTLQRRFLELEGFFRGELVIEDQQLNLRDNSLETSVDAEVGYSGWFVKLKGKFLAKIKAQTEYRHCLRKFFRPRINELIELLDDLFSNIAICKGDKLPLVVLDGLDRMSVDSAQKLFSHDGQTLALIRNASLLLTVPISIIHSPLSAQLPHTLGKIQVFKNLRLRSHDGSEDQVSRGNRQHLRDFVLRRIDKQLISDEALDLAITYSGGVFRTLLDFLSEAAVIAVTNGSELIDREEMEETLREERINKTRPLDRRHWRLLDKVAREGNFNEENNPAVLEILQGLFALEYNNGEEWYGLNPLLAEGLERFRRIEANEAERLRKGSDG